MHIAVVIHRLDNFAGMPYGIRAIAAAWRDLGHTVTITADPHAALAADAVLPHIDLTAVPPAIRRVLDRHPLVLNRGLWDIAKRAWSANLVRRGDPWPGPVIVKTDLNCGGIPERIHFAQRARLVRLWRAVALHLPGGDRRWAADLGPYRVYDRIADVPDAAWRSRALVVERFLPERRGATNVVRFAWLLGDRSLQLVGERDAPQVKAAAASDWGVTREPLPAEIWRLCAERGIDYAKIDFTIVDGRANVLDVNRTPVAALLTAAHPDMLRWLAGGLDAAIAARRPPRRGELSS